MKPILLPAPGRSCDLSAHLPVGMTHPVGAPCPFADDHLPLLPNATCCAIDVSDAVRILASLGDKRTAGLLGHSMSEDGALLLVTILRYAVIQIERRYDEREEEDTDDSRAQRTVDPTSSSLLNGSRDSLEEALMPIRKVADWCEKVARLGFDVEARR